MTDQEKDVGALCATEAVRASVLSPDNSLLFSGGAVIDELADGRWHTARALVDTLGFDERLVRLIADRSMGQIISGQKGYKLTKCATVEEIDHAERWLLSQARKMTERATEIRRARNQGGRAA